MDRKGSYIILILLSIIFSSCFDNNEIFFDIKMQSINTCNQKGIRRLYIENTATSEMYKIEFNDTLGNDALGVIYLGSKNGSYNIYKGWEKQLLSNQSLRLSPLSQYSIKRVQGDASGYKIEVWTDKDGKVTRTSKSDCSN